MNDSKYHYAKKMVIAEGTSSSCCSMEYSEEEMGFGAIDYAPLCPSHYNGDTNDDTSTTSHVNAICDLDTDGENSENDVASIRSGHGFVCDKKFKTEPKRVQNRDVEVQSLDYLWANRYITAAYAALSGNERKPSMV